MINPGNLIAYLAVITTVIIVIVKLVAEELKQNEKLKKKANRIAIFILSGFLLALIILGVVILIINGEEPPGSTDEPITASVTPSTSSVPTATITNTPTLTESPSLAPTKSPSTTTSSIYYEKGEEVEFFLQTILTLYRVFTYHKTDSGEYSEGYSEGGCTYTTPLEITISGLDDVEGILWETKAEYLDDGIYKAILPGPSERLEIRSNKFTYGSPFSSAEESSYENPHEYNLSSLQLVTIFPEEGSLDNCKTLMNMDYKDRSKNTAYNLDRSYYNLEPIDHFSMALGNYLIVYKDGNTREIEITQSGVFDFSNLEN